MERSKNRAGRSQQSAEPVFILLERDPLVAEDMTGSLMEIGPCRVIHVGDHARISTALLDEERVSAAFLDMPFETVLENGLDEQLNGRGARIVLTVGEDDQARALARGWGMLIRPFTDQMIRDVVFPRPF